MQGTAIPSEFNPFHNGHKYIISQVRKQTGTPFVGAVMSGSFVQRGEPALYDKFTRTKAALLGGADIVVELPMPYATGSADVFAYGCADIITKSGIFSHISFGTESDSIAPLIKAADILFNEPPVFKENLSRELSKGISYPAARAAALQKTAKISPHVLSGPNNILALEYIRALKILNSTVKAFAVKRINNSYNSSSLTGSISSAAAIRKALYAGKDDVLFKTVPNVTASLYKAPLASLPNLEVFAETLRYIIFTSTPGQLSKISDVTEGLENKIIANSDFKTINDLLLSIKSKRYTLSKLRRALLHILLNVKKSQTFPPKPVPYIRVLGVRRSQISLLSCLAEKSQAPVLINIKKDEAKLTDEAKELFALETLSTDLYFRKKFKDYTTGIIIM